jgi:hypothetical protein
MKRSLFTLAIACAISVAATVGCVMVDVGAAMVGFARAAYAATVELAKATFVGPQPMNQAADVLPAQHLVAARAFVQRLVKRDRPLLSAGWRMCPST